MKHLTWVAPNAFMEMLHIQTENQHIQLTVQSTHTFTHCPTCDTVSSRIHSCYTRFRQAISKANPAIEQVYDRWHCIRNAKKHVTNYIATLLPATITWSSPHKMNTETLAVSFTHFEKEVFARQTQKRRLIQQVKNAYKEGQTIAQLA